MRGVALTREQCIAINLFHRKNVTIAILCKVFGVAKNTLYYKALTGDADSYPNSGSDNQAKEINDFVDGVVGRMGLDAAINEYTTPEQRRAINAANENRILHFKKRRRGR